MMYCHEFIFSDEEYARKATALKQSLLALEQKLHEIERIPEARKVLRSFDFALLRGVLNKAASSPTWIPDKQPRKPGRQQKVCTSSVVLLFWLYTSWQSMSKTAAYTKIALELGVEPETIRALFKRNQIMSLVPSYLLNHPAISTRHKREVICSKFQNQQLNTDQPRA